MDLSTLKPTGLIFDGKVIPCDVPVWNWHDTGLETVIGGNNKARKPTQEVDLFVVHWTGGVGDAEAVFKVLGKRDLGVEFFIDYGGEVVLYCDPILVNTADAGFVNPRSFGVEVRCPGFPRARMHADQRPYRGKMRGKTLDMVDFTAAQKRSLKAIIDAVRASRHPLVNIPATVPRDARGQLLTTTLTKQEVRNYSGVIGHYHLSANKADPGPAPLQFLADQGYR